MTEADCGTTLKQLCKYKRKFVYRCSSCNYGLTHISHFSKPHCPWHFASTITYLGTKSIQAVKSENLPWERHVPCFLKPNFPCIHIPKKYLIDFGVSRSLKYAIAPLFTVLFSFCLHVPKMIIDVFPSPLKLLGEPQIGHH